MKATLSVPHGCDGSPTTALRVRIPEGVTSFTPQVNPGWAIDVTEDGGEVTEVTWTGGPLAPDQLDEFGLSLKLPEGAAGETLYFPIVQQCEGGEVAWVEIAEPGGEEPEHPAGTVLVTAADDGEPADAHDGAPATVDAQPVAATLVPEPDPLAYAALAAGMAGLLLGAAALLVARRAPR